MGSGRVPVNTVQAVAVMPGRSSLRGKKPPVEGGGVAEAWTAEPAGAAAGDAAWPMATAGRSATQGKTTNAAKRSLVSFRLVPTSIRVQPDEEG